MSFLHPDRAKESLKEHRQIYEALLSHNKQEAEKFILLHIENAEKNVLENV